MILYLKNRFIIQLILTLWLFIPPIIIANQQLSPHFDGFKVSLFHKS